MLYYSCCITCVRNGNVGAPSTDMTSPFELSLFPLKDASEYTFICNDSMYNFLYLKAFIALLVMCLVKSFIALIFSSLYVFYIIFDNMFTPAVIFGPTLLNQLFWFDQRLRAFKFKKYFLHILFALRSTLHCFCLLLLQQV